ncbi:MAG: IS4 family transposase [Planctomycetota bacterium]|nr:IS4 family transposase [Planctomycetota bacterium]
MKQRRAVHHIFTTTDLEKLSKGPPPVEVKQLAKALRYVDRNLARWANGATLSRKAFYIKQLWKLARQPTSLVLELGQLDLSISIARRCRTLPRFSQVHHSLRSAYPAEIRQLLPDEFILEILNQFDVKFRQRVFCPVVTLWLWLGQVFEADGSCRAAVGQVFGRLVGRLPVWMKVSTDCSGYSQARKRLPESVTKEVACAVAEEMDSLATDQTFQRRVYLVDGSSCSVSDTKKNQAEYPQPDTQKEGCGFPFVRMVGFFSLVSGALKEISLGTYFDSEQTLFRQLWEKLKPQDLIIADGLYGTYMNMVLLKEKGVDCLTKAGKRRNLDLTNSERLGKKDWLVELKRPKRPTWMSKDEYARIPKTFKARYVEYSVEIPGRKTKVVQLMTTLLDHKTYTPKKLAELYACRWTVEVDFRHLKTTLGMNVIEVKTPEMIRKAIWIHTLAYNLIRKVMWDASVKHQIPINTVSFKGTLQLIEGVGAAVNQDSNLANFKAYDALLEGISRRPVRPRPNRWEPRAIRRRKNKYPFMIKPRSEYKTVTKALTN